jgi:hypothetical protein
VKKFIYLSKHTDLHQDIHWDTINNVSSAQEVPNMHLLSYKPDHIPCAAELYFKSLPSFKDNFRAVMEGKAMKENIAFHVALRTKKFKTLGPDEKQLWCNKVKELKEAQTAGPDANKQAR